MIARLWWKEWRVFGPAAGLLLLGAAGVQWIYLTSNGSFARDGSATPIALIWAVLYAYAAGAAAFAGEREGKTLGFLDALPVPRRTLWLGKASFALVTTAALGLLLFGLASLATTNRNSQVHGVGELARNFSLYCLEGLAWGLFWSSVLRNPLGAGAMAVVSVGLVAFFANLYLGMAQATDWVHESSRLALALLALAGSAVGMIARLPTIRVEIGRAARRAYDVPIARATTGLSLAWQGYREGWTTMALALLLAFLFPGLAILAGGRRIDPGSELIMASLACLTMGIGAFGGENATGTRRFLHDHGVSPVSAWAWKMTVWSVPLAAISALLYAIGFAGREFGPSGPEDLGAFPIALLLDAFGIGLICGMTGRRRITSGLVGVLALIGLAIPQIIAVGMALIPPSWMFIAPSILIAASLAWSGDWLADRRGVRPYLRLLAILAIPFGLEAIAYVSYRAWGLPDIARIAPAPLADPDPIPPAEDAAEAYRRAAALIGDRSGLALQNPGLLPEEDWDPETFEARRWAERNGRATEAARKASALGRVAPAPAADLSPAGPKDAMLVACRELFPLLARDARDRMTQGDLAGAWDDILAELRMAGHLTAARPTQVRMQTAAAIHHQAVALAIDWAGHQRQSAAAIARALADVRGLPAPPTIAACLPGEADQVERTLDLPPGELDDLLHEGKDRYSYDVSPWQRFTFALFGAPPWERERARRVARRFFADRLDFYRLEPFRRNPAWVGEPRGQGPEFRGSPLALQVIPNVDGVVRWIDREVENRRALELVLALRAWQFAHDGKYPEKLEDLVPTVLDRLPADPYSGRPFGYVVSEGQPIRPPALNDVGGEAGQARPTRRGQRLIYSVGPDWADDHAAGSYQFIPFHRGDLVVPLP